MNKSEFLSIFCSGGIAEMLFQFDPKRIRSKVILTCSFTSEPKPILYSNFFLQHLLYESGILVIARYSVSLSKSDFFSVSCGLFS